MSQSTAAGRGPFVIPSLDGLRAVSFLFVFLGHVGTPGIPGGFGVTVFFFLSGYLITTLLRLEVEKSGGISLKLFYLRRALRIWPPFYIVLVSATVLAALGVVQGTLQAPAVLSQILHYSNYRIAIRGWEGIAQGTGVYWSLAVEEHFYLLFPALYSLLLRRGFSPRGQRGVFFAICGAVLAWRTVLICVLHVVPDRTYLATDARVDSILFGCGLAVYGNPAIDLPELDRPRSRDVGLLFLGLTTLMVSFALRDSVFRETLRYTLQGLGLYPVFIFAVRFPKWGVMRILNLRPVKFMGTLSYSLYLLHHVVIGVVFERWEKHVLFASVLSLTAAFLLATVIWYFVEEPCAAVRRRLNTNRVAASKSGEPALS